jgi:hypothetical protein
VIRRHAVQIGDVRDRSSLARGSEIHERP